jgi:glycosyltransferase involved in cell wall biosynthesis
MTRIKKIQMYPFTEDLHTIHNSIVSQPPEGYEFTGVKASKLYNWRKKLNNSKTVRFLYHQFLKFFKTTKVIEATQSSNILPEADLVFSQGIIYNSNKPWILYMFDHPACLAGNNYKLFLKNKSRFIKALLHPSCKKIICTNSSPIPFMKEHFPYEVNNKVTQVNLAIQDHPHKRTYNKDKIKILFLGSVNNPEDFYIKGGLDAIEVFNSLSDRKDVELIMRCKIPESEKQKIKQSDNIKILDKRIPYEEIVNLFKTSDILFLPGHNYSVSAFLEGMSYGTPVVALNTYAVEDFIKHNHNGIIVKRSDKIQGYNNPGYPTFIRDDAFMSEVLNTRDPELVTRLIKTLTTLIDNPQKIEELGKNARKEFENNYTIEHRNLAFKKIFDEILAEKSLYTSQNSSRNETRTKP